MEEVIKQFLAVSLSSGSGSGSGSGEGAGSAWGSGWGSGLSGEGLSGEGSGSGSGEGEGSGSGWGSGLSSGSGSGSGLSSGSGWGSGSAWGLSSGEGSGWGSGEGIRSFNGNKVYRIDGVQTIIKSVHGNYAKGFILNSDLTLTETFIAKVGDCFAHGETLRQAMDDAQAKYDEHKPLSERIEDTIKKYPTLDTEVPHAELFSLHHTLTGSCLQGRTAFASDHNLDPENGTMTMREFINLTINAYGGDAIAMLAKAYGINNYHLTT